MKFKDYKILNGRESSYDLRDEIKSWGGYWDTQNWIISTSKGDGAYKALIACGLRLVEV